MPKTTPQKIGHGRQSIFILHYNAAEQNSQLIPPKKFPFYQKIVFDSVKQIEVRVLLEDSISGIRLNNMFSH